MEKCCFPLPRNESLCLAIVEEASRAQHSVQAASPSRCFVALILTGGEEKEDFLPSDRK